MVHASTPAANKPRTVAASKPRTVAASKPRTVAASKPRTVGTGKPRTVGASKPRTVAASKPRAADKPRKTASFARDMLAPVRTLNDSSAFKQLVSVSSSLKKVTGMRAI